jgi:ankyrin repeat protein
MMDEMNIETISAFDKHGWTKLHYACQNGNENLVYLLIRKGVDVNAQQGNGWTPLFAATRFGHLSIIRLLLCSGANPNIASYDEYGELLTPIQLSEQYHYNIKDMF